MADGKCNNKHSAECLNGQIMLTLQFYFSIHVQICKFSSLKEPLFGANRNFTLCLDNIRSHRQSEFYQVLSVCSHNVYEWLSIFSISNVYAGS